MLDIDDSQLLKCLKIVENKKDICSNVWQNFDLKFNLFYLINIKNFAKFINPLKFALVEKIFYTRERIRGIRVPLSTIG